MENNRHDDLHEIPDDGEKHKFSMEYENRKSKLLAGIKDVEEYSSRAGKKKERTLSGRFVKVAVILMCAVILIPVSISAAVTVYRFTVNQNGHTATGTIQMNEDGTSQMDADSAAVTATDEMTADMKEEDATDSGKEYSKTGRDGTSYRIDPDRRYIEIDFSYLPAGMVRVEENKYDLPDRETDMGLSIDATQWDGGAYDVANRDVEKARTLIAGEYEYLLFKRGGVDYSFDRLVYIPVKAHSVIVTMYVGREITESDLNKIIAGMSINEDIGNDPAKWIKVGTRILDDSGDDKDTDSSAAEQNDRFTQVNLNEEFIRGGYKIKVNAVDIYDNLCGIPQSDIVYWFGNLDSRFVDDNGKFKAVRCRRLIETTDEKFSSWGDYNDSSLRLAAVDMTYKSCVSDGMGEAGYLDFYLDRGEFTDENSLKCPATTNYYYSGDDVSAQNSRQMTCVSPVYAETDGRTAGLTDVTVSMVRDGETHDLKVYFLIDESEINDSIMEVAYSGSNNQFFDYASIYLDSGK